MTVVSEDESSGNEHADIAQDLGQSKPASATTTLLPTSPSPSPRVSPGRVLCPKTPSPAPSVADTTTKLAAFELKEDANKLSKEDDMQTSTIQSPLPHHTSLPTSSPIEPALSASGHSPIQSTLHDTNVNMDVDNNDDRSNDNTMEEEEVEQPMTRDEDELWKAFSPEL